MFYQLRQSTHIAFRETCAWGRIIAHALPLALLAVLVAALATDTICPPISGSDLVGPVHTPILGVWNTPVQWDTWEDGPMSLVDRWRSFEKHVDDLGIRQQVSSWVLLLIDTFVASWIIAVCVMRAYHEKCGYYTAIRIYIFAFIVPALAVLLIYSQSHQWRAIERPISLVELYWHCDMFNPCGENK